MARVLLTLVAAALFNGSSAFMARSPMSRLIHRSTTSDSQARCDVVLGAYNKVIDETMKAYVLFFRPISCL
jgi:hypothetical protein